MIRFETEPTPVPPAPPQSATDVLPSPLAADRLA